MEIGSLVQHCKDPDLIGIVIKRGEVPEVPDWAVAWGAASLQEASQTPLEDLSWHSEGKLIDLG